MAPDWYRPRFRPARIITVTLQEILDSDVTLANESSLSMSIRVAIYSAPFPGAHRRVTMGHGNPWSACLPRSLVRMGLDVTLFATGDSQTSGTLAAVCPRPYSEDRFSRSEGCGVPAHLRGLRTIAAEFDLIHNHFDFLPLTYSGLINTPVVTTIHGFLIAGHRSGLQEIQCSLAIMSRSARPTNRHGSTISPPSITASILRNFRFPQPRRKVSPVLRSNPSGQGRV